jgi:pimeloyl-ACP methyl ester carboxylesterase
MAAQPQTKAKIFVLVHGAWHGGWCWRRLADLLTARGHKVYAPTLTGLGERSHLMSGSITLATHVADVANVLKWERLNHVVLVGHSYAGLVISGVAEQAASAIGAMVFLDAFVPEDGQCLMELTAPATRELIEAAREKGSLAVPPRPAEFFKVNEADRDWVDAMCTPHPIATLFDKVALSGARERIAKKVYIRAQAYPNPGFDAALATVKSNPAWRVYELPCGHDAMIDMPGRLAEILMEIG